MNKEIILYKLEDNDKKSPMSEMRSRVSTLSLMPNLLLQNANKIKSAESTIVKPRKKGR